MEEELAAYRFNPDSKRDLVNYLSVIPMTARRAISLSQLPQSDLDLLRMVHAAFSDWRRPYEVSCILRGFPWDFFRACRGLSAPPNAYRGERCGILGRVAGAHDRVYLITKALEVPSFRVLENSWRKS